MKKEIDSPPSQCWDILWDLWCVISVIGIWPRFIEPKLVWTTNLDISLPNLSPKLDGLKIAFLSDFHISNISSSSFLKRVSQKIARAKPNLILLGGDFLSYSDLSGLPLLRPFLGSFSAPCGVFACLGNHDYQQYVTLGDNGEFVIKESSKSSIISGFKRLFSSRSAGQEDVPRTSPLEKLPALTSLLASSGIQLLDNRSTVLHHDGGRLQIAGLGDLMAGHCDPQQAFSAWDPRIPGIVISHNPDSWPLLKAYPGDLYLFGHTHGGQVNLPWMWEKLTPIINKRLKRGLFQEETSWTSFQQKVLYVSRGIGATFPFRFFSIPEIVSITLKSCGPAQEALFQKNRVPDQYISTQSVYSRTADEQAS